MNNLTNIPSQPSDKLKENRIRFCGIVIKVEPPLQHERTGEKMLIFTVKALIEPHNWQYYSCKVTGDCADDAFEDLDAGDEVRISARFWEVSPWIGPGGHPRATVNVLPDDIEHVVSY